MDIVLLTAGDLVAATGGRLLSGSESQSIAGISIDSRTAAAGDLFVAIRGERFDGHAFVGEVLGRGALGAIVSVVPPIETSVVAPVVIQVEDTTRALQDIARDVRRRSGTRVVAITGSAGKTSTKEIAAEFLSARFRVFRNKGNLNNHIGLPLSLLHLRDRPDVAVVELGMNHPGEIRALVGIAEPDVRVWTNVGDAHMGFFGSADEIADAKGEILEGATPASVLVANGDDPRVILRAQRFAGRLVTFGLQPGGDVHPAAVTNRGLDGFAADIVVGRKTVHIDVPLIGTGNLYNLLAAAAIADVFGVTPEDIAARAAALRPATHRGELLRLPGGVTIIDDSYNSSPSALKRALETVKIATGCARKVAVLGEMLELGAHATALHEACGAAAAQAGLDLLIVVGGEPAVALADAARAAGIAADAVIHVDDSERAVNVALNRVRPGDLVLVKGSRGVRTDVVVERLKGEFA